MQILKDSDELQRQCDTWYKTNQIIALVPTMGFYHAGHEALMRYARQQADKLIISLFVNPTQFAPGEDFEAYPRDWEHDCNIAEINGADILFAPEPEMMYKENHASWVEVPELSNSLCGASRPGHFRGVCTIVLKLFLLTKAHIAVFGQKDWQQQAILKRMTRDLNVPIHIESRPIERESDGLALSSRNVYLTESERKNAPEIYKGLLLAKQLAQAGEKNGRRLLSAVLSYWRKKIPDGRLDYLNIVNPITLKSVDNICEPALMACAIRIGKARLIDNILLD